MFRLAKFNTNKTNFPFKPWYINRAYATKDAPPPPLSPLPTSVKSSLPTWEEIRTPPSDPNFYYKNVEKTLFEEYRKDLLDKTKLLGDVEALEEVDEASWGINLDFTQRGQKNELEAWMKKFNDPIEIYKFQTTMIRNLAQNIREAEEDDPDFEDGAEERIYSEEEEAALDEMASYVGVEGGFPHQSDPEYLPKLPPEIPDLLDKSDKVPCYFCTTLADDKRVHGKATLMKYHVFNPMNVPLLTQFLNGNGAILGREISSCCPRHQRKISKVMRKAIHMGFFSWKKSNFRINSPFPLPEHLSYHTEIPEDHLGAIEEFKEESKEVKEEEVEEEGEKGFDEGEYKDEELEVQKPKRFKDKKR